MSSKRFSSEGPIGRAGKPIPGVTLRDGMTPFDKVVSFMKNVDDSGNFQGFGADLSRNNLTLISATLHPGSTPSDQPTCTAVFEMTVTPDLCNRMGNLHGGATALIMDVATTCALAPIARRGYWQFAGVTRTLNLTYFRPAPMGSRVVVTCEVVQAGRTVCTIRGMMTDKTSGKLLNMAEHGKIGIDPPARKDNGKEPATRSKL